MGYQEIKLEWPEVPRLKLKLLFLTHLILISWSSLGQWAEQAVLIHNLMFLFTFVWCIIQHDNEDSIFLCFLEDLEVNDGTPEKPYYMTRDLMKLLSKRNQRDESEKND